MRGITFYFPWELGVMQWLQGFASPVLTAIASAISMFGEEFVMIGILGFLYWCYDKRWGEWIAVYFLPAMMASSMLKNLVLRRRPYMDHDTIRCLKKVSAEGELNDLAAQGYSFPSLHAGNTLNLFGLLATWVKKRWYRILSGVLIFLIGLSRVYLGVHYPTDVLVGWGVGAATLGLIGLLRKKIKNPTLCLGIFAILTIPGWFFCTSNDFFSAYGLLLGIAAGLAAEQRFVRFDNTRSIVRCILRVLGGIALFLALNTLLKWPFSDEFLESATFAAHAVRAARYAVISFFFIAVYPILFRFTAKIGK